MLEIRVKTLVTAIHIELCSALRENLRISPGQGAVARALDTLLWQISFQALKAWRGPADSLKCD